MAKYVTKQRRILLEYLEQHPDELLSAQEIADALSKENISISAVYRNFAQLEAEGKIRRTSQNGKRNVYYQYVAAPKCKECLHLNCSKCGNSYHLNSDFADFFVQCLSQTAHFQIDKANTVICGICDACKE